MPKLPQKAAGMRTEPAPSVPTDSGPSPAATAAAVPPDEPPGVLLKSHGLRVIPLRGELVSPLQPNSGVVVLPSSTAPASRNRAVAGASVSHTCFSSTVRLPRRVGQPRVRIRSLIDTGTPSSAPAGAPCAQRASLSRACCNADSCATRQNALSWGLSASMRSSTARVASTGEAWRRRYSPSSSVALQSARFVAAVWGDVILASSTAARACRAITSYPPSAARCAGRRARSQAINEAVGRGMSQERRQGTSRGKARSAQAGAFSPNRSRSAWRYWACPSACVSWWVPP